MSLSPHGTGFDGKHNTSRLEGSALYQDRAAVAWDSAAQNVDASPEKALSYATTSPTSLSSAIAVPPPHARLCERSNVFSCVNEDLAKSSGCHTSEKSPLDRGLAGWASAQDRERWGRTLQSPVYASDRPRHLLDHSMHPNSLSELKTGDALARQVSSSPSMITESSATQDLQATPSPPIVDPHALYTAAESSMSQLTSRRSELPHESSGALISGVSDTIATVGTTLDARRGRAALDASLAIPADKPPSSLYPNYGGYTQPSGASESLESRLGPITLQQQVTASNYPELPPRGRPEVSSTVPSLAVAHFSPSARRSLDYHNSRSVSPEPGYRSTSPIYSSIDSLLPPLAVATPLSPDTKRNSAYLRTPPRSVSAASDARGSGDMIVSHDEKELDFASAVAGLHQFTAHFGNDQSTDCEPSFESAVAGLSTFSSLTSAMPRRGVPSTMPMHELPSTRVTGTAAALEEFLSRAPYGEEVRMRPSATVPAEPAAEPACAVSPPSAEPPRAMSLTRLHELDHSHDVDVTFAPDSSDLAVCAGYGRLQVDCIKKLPLFPLVVSLALITGATELHMLCPYVSFDTDKQKKWEAAMQQLLAGILMTAFRWVLHALFTAWRGALWYKSKAALDPHELVVSWRRKLHAFSSWCTHVLQDHSDSSRSRYRAKATSVARHPVRPRYELLESRIMSAEAKVEMAERKADAAEWRAKNAEQRVRRQAVISAEEEAEAFVDGEDSSLAQARTRVARAQRQAVDLEARVHHLETSLVETEARACDALKMAEVQTWERAVASAAKAELSMETLQEVQSHRCAELCDTVNQLELTAAQFEDRNQLTQSELRIRAEACVELAEVLDHTTERAEGDRYFAVEEAEYCAELVKAVREAERLATIECQERADAERTSRCHEAELLELAGVLDDRVEAAQRETVEQREFLLELAREQTEAHRRSMIDCLRKRARSWVRKIARGMGASSKARLLQTCLLAWWREGIVVVWHRQLEQAEGRLTCAEKDAQDAREELCVEAQTVFESKLPAVNCALTSPSESSCRLEQPCPDLRDTHGYEHVNVQVHLTLRLFLFSWRGVVVSCRAAAPSRATITQSATSLDSFTEVIHAAAIAEAQQLESAEVFAEEQRTLCEALVGRAATARVEALEMGQVAAEAMRRAESAEASLQTLRQSTPDNDIISDVVEGTDVSPEDLLMMCRCITSWRQAGSHCKDLEQPPRQDEVNASALQHLSAQMRQLGVWAAEGARLRERCAFRAWRQAIVNSNRHRHFVVAHALILRRHKEGYQLRVAFVSWRGVTATTARASHIATTVATTAAADAAAAAKAGEIARLRERCAFGAWRQLMANSNQYHRLVDAHAAIFRRQKNRHQMRVGFVAWRSVPAAAAAATHAVTEVTTAAVADAASAAEAGEGAWLRERCSFGAWRQAVAISRRCHRFLDAHAAILRRQRLGHQLRVAFVAWRGVAAATAAATHAATAAATAAAADAAAALEAAESAALAARAATYAPPPLPQCSRARPGLLRRALRRSEAAVRLLDQSWRRRCVFFAWTACIVSPQQQPAATETAQHCSREASLRFDFAAIRGFVASRHFVARVALRAWRLPMERARQLRAAVDRLNRACRTRVSKVQLCAVLTLWYRIMRSARLLTWRWRTHRRGLLRIIFDVWRFHLFEWRAEFERAATGTASAPQTPRSSTRPLTERSPSPAFAAGARVSDVATATAQAWADAAGPLQTPTTQKPMSTGSDAASVCSGAAPSGPSSDHGDFWRNGLANARDLRGDASGSRYSNSAAPAPAYAGGNQSHRCSSAQRRLLEQILRRQSSEEVLEQSRDGLSRALEASKTARADPTAAESSDDISTATAPLAQRAATPRLSSGAARSGASTPRGSGSGSGASCTTVGSRTAARRSRVSVQELCGGSSVGSHSDGGGGQGSYAALAQARRAAQAAAASR